MTIRSAESHAHDPRRKPSLRPGGTTAAGAGPHQLAHRAAASSSPSWGRAAAASRLCCGWSRGSTLPTTGSLFMEGKAIEGPDPSRIVVFQDPTLYPWRTVWSNVALGLEARGLLRSHRDRVDDALRLVGLTGFANAYPHQLSGGMSQRAALARALVNDPKLLILDEPLGQLNSLTRIAMQGELVSLWQRAGFTALLVTHDVEEALFLAGRVIVLSERPAHIKAEVVNTRPYPRHRGDPHLVELRREIMGHLGLAESW